MKNLDSDDFALILQTNLLPMKGFKMADGLASVSAAFSTEGLHRSTLSLKKILALVADVKARGVSEVRVPSGAGFAVLEELALQGVRGVRVLEQDGLA